MLDLNMLDRLSEEAHKDIPTGDPFLDSRYDSYTELVGHTNPYYRLFYLLSKCVQPERYLELGVDTGLAIAHVAAGCPTCDCIGIDIWADGDEPMHKSQEVERRYSNVRLVRSWSVSSAMEEWTSLHPECTGTQLQWHRQHSGPIDIGLPVDFLYIDAWHDYKFAMDEWNHYSRYLIGNAIVACDDITTAFFFKGMDRFWQTVSQGCNSIFSSTLHPHVGFGIAVTTLPVQESGPDGHVPGTREEST